MTGGAGLRPGPHVAGRGRPGRGRRAARVGRRLRPSERWPGHALRRASRVSRPGRHDGRRAAQSPRCWAWPGAAGADLRAGIARGLGPCATARSGASSPTGRVRRRVRGGRGRRLGRAVARRRRRAAAAARDPAAGVPLPATRRRRRRRGRQRHPPRRARRLPPGRRPRRRPGRRPQDRRARPAIATTAADGSDGVVDAGARERGSSTTCRAGCPASTRPRRRATCLYTETPSEDFLLDRVGPIVICSPCSGHGAKFAPLIGEFVAGLVTGDRPVPDRFRLGAHTSMSAVAKVSL